MRPARLLAGEAGLEHARRIHEAGGTIDVHCSVFTPDSFVSVLGEVIAKATGMSEAEYAKEKLFDPLQMEQAEWWQDAKGHTLGWCCVDASARAYARFGQLYLQQAQQQGQTPGQ